MRLATRDELRVGWALFKQQVLIDPISTLWRSGFSRARCLGVKALYKQAWAEWEEYYNSLPDPDEVYE